MQFHLDETKAQKLDDNMRFTIDLICSMFGKKEIMISETKAEREFKGLVKFLESEQKIKPVWVGNKKMYNRIEILKWQLCTNKF